MKKTAGLSALSQVWKDYPAYYFWLENAPCAYFLGLENSVIEKAEGTEIATGLFVIKCYPYRNSELFRRFSKEEQRLLLSDHFDGSNTPSFSKFDDIPAYCYSVGTIELTYSFLEKADWRGITLESLDSINAVAKMGSHPAGVNENGSQNKLVRQVPGWALAYRLFDSLCLIHSFYFQTKPAKTVLRDAVGFVTFCDESGVVWTRNDNCSRLMSISVEVSENDDPHSEDIDDRSCDSPNDHNLLITIKGDPRPEDYLNSRKGAFAGLPGINPEWWTISSENFVCDLNTPCGCS